MTSSAIFDITSKIIKKFGLEPAHVDPHTSDDFEDAIYLDHLATDPRAEGHALIIEVFADGKAQVRHETHDRDIAPSTHWSSKIANPDEVFAEVEKELPDSLDRAGRALRRHARR